MLPPDGRAVLLDLLRPPPGAELVRGIATTFTLDLTSALTAPLAFAGHALSVGKDPVAILHAVGIAADRLDIFCQAGQTIVPATASDLMAYLEPMVHAVKSPHSGGLFHPKIWLLEFADEVEHTFRLLVTSRNLTADQSWDVVVRLDGVAGSRPSASNRPLVDLVTSLPAWAIHPLPTDRLDRIHALAEAVRRVEWDPPEDVWELEFHALGVKGRRSSVDFAGTRHLVISPFITDEGLRGVAPSGSSSLQVVSRVDDLEKLAPETLAGVTAAFILDDAAALGGDEEDDGPEAESMTVRGVLAGLHAKTYVIEYDRAARVLVGSANATGAAFNGNIEFLLEMKGSKSKLGIDTFVGDSAAFRQILVPYQPEGGAVETSDEEADRALDAALREVAVARFRCTVEAVGDQYDLHVSTVDPVVLSPSLDATVAIMTQLAHGQPLLAVVAASYVGVELADVTPFLVVRLTDGRRETRSCVVQAELIGDPPGRRDAIMARQVDTPEKFLRFLALLLSLGTADLAALMGGGGGGAGAGAWTSGPVGVFETLVRALGAKPSALDDLAPLVERLRSTNDGEHVLPDGFDELWTIVWDARNQLRDMTV